jgi:hypothetical protein
VVWAAHWRIFFHDLISPVTAVLGVVAAFFAARRWVVHGLISLALLLVVQVVFHVLYAWHDYYYVANAFALMMAAAMFLIGALESGRIPRGLALSAMLLAFGCQITLWSRSHYRDQQFESTGGNRLNVMIKFISAPDEAFVIAQEDWNSMMPYYSERRALMLRDDIIRSPEKLRAAFVGMKGTPVAMLILRNAWRNDRNILHEAAVHLGIDERPALSWQGDHIYLHRDLRAEVLSKLEKMGMEGFADFTLAPEAKLRDRPLANAVRHYSELAGRHQKLFQNMHPAPESFFSTVGPELWIEPEETRFFAHPETKLWFALAAGSYRLRTSIALTANSYTDIPAADATDGVFLIVTAIDVRGERRELYRQHVNPRDNPADRRVREVDVPILLESAGKLELAVTAGPTGNAARDWASLGKISIEPEKPNQ